MKTVIADFENWHIQCIPEDGGRISVLKFAGYDLLTRELPGFKPPDRFLGIYETRPVYGYDDCFPTVDPCIYPGDQTECRDHGELYSLEWKVLAEKQTLNCSAECLNPRVSFKRILTFDGYKLCWRFEVVNKSSRMIKFLHVMHALMPLENIQYFSVPGFISVIDEITQQQCSMKDPQELYDHLAGVSNGNYNMILLRNTHEGFVKIGFKEGFILYIRYNCKMFPTLGVWWNNSGYPEEKGLERNECAFEPIPGTCSNLSKSSADGIFLSAAPGKKLCWEIDWELEVKKN